jgi:hypothetical protein
MSVTKQKLKEAEEKPYLGWIRNELQITNTKVAKWCVWDPEEGDFVAYIDSRRVIIPIPVCDWSFLIGLHEIGHVSTGHRLYSYLMEYNAEKWAIKRAKDNYGIVSLEYEEDAKRYVKQHLIANLIDSDLKITKIKPYVLDWLNETPETIMEYIQNENEQPINTDTLPRRSSFYFSTITSLVSKQWSIFQRLVQG